MLMITLGVRVTHVKHNANDLDIRSNTLAGLIPSALRPATTPEAGVSWEAQRCPKAAREETVIAATRTLLCFHECLLNRGYRRRPTILRSS